jgi:hypothetical protein
MRSGNIPRVVKAGDPILGDSRVFKYSRGTSGDEIRELGKCWEQL